MFRKLGISILCAVMAAAVSSTVVRAEDQSPAAQRQEHEKASEKRLKELNTKMDELAADARKAAGKTRTEMNRLYEEFKKKQENTGKELEELRKSTNETWDKARVRMDKALDDLNGLYERSKAKIKDKDETK